MKKWFTDHILGLSIFVFVICVSFIALSIGAANLLPENNRSYFIAITAALGGGLFTFFGVLLTTAFATKNSEINEIERNIPEFFVPKRFDICDATQIHLVDKTNDLHIVNKRFYFKNTDKNHFIIDCIKTEDKEFRPTSVVYVENKELFCLAFYSKQTIESFTLKLKSIDGYYYPFLIEINDNGEITTITRK